MKMKNLIIVGVGGFGREVAWLVERINAKNPTWNLLGFVDDNESILGTNVNSYPVLGTCECLSNYPDTYIVCAIGASKTRRKIIDKINSTLKDVKYATLIDPSVESSNLVSVGEGSIICAHSILTVNIEIGSHVIINLDCTVGHDVVIHNFVTVYPSVNISGNTQIMELSELGTGTQIIQGKKIGSESIVGAGSVVVKDIPEKCTAVGCPATPIKFF